MTPLDSAQTDSIVPGEYLFDEGGETAYWLASAYSPDDIRDEWDYLFDETDLELIEVWFTVRLTTPEELADPEQLYELFGENHEDQQTDKVYEGFERPGIPGAHRYWSIR